MQLKCSENRKGNRLIAAVLPTFPAVLLGGASLAVLLSCFGLTWRVNQSFGGSISGSLVHVWNGAADTFGSQRYILLARLLPDAGEAGAFLILLLLTLIAAAYLIISSGMPFLLLIYALPPAILAICFGIMPGPWQAAALFGALVIAASWIAIARRSGSGNIFRLSDGAGLILPFAALLVGLAVSIAVYNLVDFNMPKPVRNAGIGLTTAANDLRYGKDRFRGGELNGLDHDDVANPKGTALKVTMDKPQSVYLRGFVGERYEENKWNSLSDSVCYSMRDKLYWINEKGLNGLSELEASAFAASGKKPETSEVLVETAGADRRYVYTPYELSEGSIAGLGRDRANASFNVSGLRGASSYRYYMCDNMTGSWTDWVGQLFSHKRDQNVADHFNLESHYNVLQYQIYTEIPVKTEELLADEVGDAGNLANHHIDYKTAISKVDKYLSDNYIYSDNFSSIDAREDFLAAFVKNKKGCDIHYASLATAIFRYYGIPARFIEGYLITQEDAKTAGNSRASIEVPEKNHHAWTEIYIDGYGWVPIEFCPEWKGKMKEADMTKGLESMDYSDQFKKQNNTSPMRINESEAETEKTDNIWRRVGKTAIAIALIILLVLILVKLIKLLLEIWHRYRSFYAKSPRAGICAIYAYMLDRGYDLDSQTIRLGEYAAYSRGDCTEELRERMLDFYDEERVAHRRARRNR